MRDQEALARQLGHQLVEALALLRAEQIVGRHPDVVEEQLRRVLRIEADLVELPAAAEALDLVGLDDEQRDALGALAGSVLATTTIRSAIWPLEMKVLAPLIR